MQSWLPPALDYIKSWIAFQIRTSQQPGVIVAIAHRGRVVAEYAFGHADLGSGEKLTPRHRFRIASHSKSFTAAGIMKLRAQRKLRLDEPVGLYVKGLHAAVADVTIAQVLSHSAGLVRDGANSGQFCDDRPYLNASELMAELRKPPVIEPNSRFKYSNHGYGLLGFVIEAITGEPYRQWIEREIVAKAGLRETTADMPAGKPIEFARGHSARGLLGRRVVIPGDNACHAIAPAGGFVSTAGDVARFFAQLSPNAARSVLPVASRREMVRAHWRNPHFSIEQYYGLGIISGKVAGWDWFGHSGGLQGYISRTSVVPACDISICVLTNAIDGFAGLWNEGAIHILRAFEKHGAPSRKHHDWTGRWWSLWGAVDLVPMGRDVMIGNPHFFMPLIDASEIEITGRDAGRIKLAMGYSSYGEGARLVRGPSGRVKEVWLGGSRLRPERVVKAEMERRYEKGKRRRPR